MWGPPNMFKWHLNAGQEWGNMQQQLQRANAPLLTPDIKAAGAHLQHNPAHISVLMGCSSRIIISFIPPVWSLSVTGHLFAIFSRGSLASAQTRALRLSVREGKMFLLFARFPLADLQLLRSSLPAKSRSLRSFSTAAWQHIWHIWKAGAD